MTITISEIYIYPVKSCRGFAVDRAILNLWGLQYDRNWMVVTPTGKFLTQRELPRMALIETAIGETALHLHGPDQPELQVPLADHAGSVRQVEIWRDQCLAVDQGDQAADWFSQVLKTPCRLVRIGTDYDRPTNPNYAPNGQVSFADGYPLLVISAASLADLNQRLPEPIPMNRFRPNLVVTGCAAYAEDRWRQIQIDQILFDAVKPCERCVVTTTDQATGMRSSLEPIKTLSTYRRAGKNVLFGQNLVHRGEGQLQMGSRIEVVTQG
ncbi:MAG: MOSC domain-containing protein [Elainella sp. Prado103]|jgi:hypothetical protein|nr:MOSC domain-containing protein [Elainella sp. Prado103]